MKRVLNVMVRLGFRTLALVALSLALVPTGSAFAQGVTTGALSGIVTNEQKQPIQAANVIAIHLPSGTSYETATRADGRFTIPGMRLGGPYSVTVAYTGTAGTAFEPQTQEDVTINLGVASDLTFNVRAIAVQETVTVSAVTDPVFSSSRTGAATAINRVESATLPTVGRPARRHDAPDAAGEAATRSAAQDNRMNNITVDGSAFNNSFGLRRAAWRNARALRRSRSSRSNRCRSASRPSTFARATSSARASTPSPAAERIADCAPSTIACATRISSARKRDGQAVQSRHLHVPDTGVWAGGPIVKNRLFVFGNVRGRERSSGR